MKALFVTSVMLALSPGTFAGPTSAVQREPLFATSLQVEHLLTTADAQRITLPVGVKAGRHLHPCPVLGVIAQGEIVFQIEGSPEQRLRTGDAFYEPANTVIARFDNVGATAARFVAFYLLGPNDHELIRPLPAGTR